jgi:hypothetical protein
MFLRRMISLLLLLLASTIGWAASFTGAVPRMVPLQQSGIRDGSFEGGTPNTDWDEKSLVYGTPICYVKTCGTGAGTGPRTGDYWVWFGGTEIYEKASVSQDVAIPTGTTRLTFWLEIPEASGTGKDYMEVSIDDVVIFRVTDKDKATYGSYTQVEIDIASYADGASHTVTFLAETRSVVIQRTSFFVDDVALATGSVSPTPGTGTPTPTPYETPTPQGPTPTPYGPTPNVIQITPDEGISNSETNVEISGSNFVATPEIELRRDTSSIPLRDITFVDATRLLAVVPVRVAPGKYDIVVINPGGKEGTLPNGFTVRSPDPQITDVIPDQGRADLPGDITIYGFNFLEGVSVYLDTSTLSTNRVNANMLQATLDAGSLSAGTYDLVVTNSDGSRGVLPGAFTLFEPSQVDVFSDERGIWTLPAVPRPGAATDIGLIVYRQGGTQTTPAVPVHIYVGDPNAGGTLLGEGLTAPIAPSDTGSSSSSVSWKPPKAGTFTIYAVIDPDNVTGETDDARKNNTISRDVEVQPPRQDQTAPHVDTFSISNGISQTKKRTITLSTSASDVGNGVASVFYIEYTYNQGANQWVPVKQSDWIDYAQAQNYSWSLHPEAGVHYLQAWAADNDNNISTYPNKKSLSYEPPEDQVRRDQSRVYRYAIGKNEVLSVQLEILEGDADLYVWPPDWDQGRPPWVSNLSSGNEYLRMTTPVSGSYQVEVYGYTQATYRLSAVIQSSAAAAATADGMPQQGGEDPDKTQPSSPVVPITSQPADRLQVAPPTSDVPPTDTYTVFLPRVVR